MKKSSDTAASSIATPRKSRGHRGYRVKIFDLSIHGCKAEFIERPKLDELVWVKLEGLDALEAMVCWVRGFEVGLEFESPMHPAVFDMMVARLAP